MARFVKGDVVVIPFPFSDLSQSKRRPALVVATLEGDDVILCQLTSKTIRDDYAIPLDDADFASGNLSDSRAISGPIVCSQPIPTSSSTGWAVSRATNWPKSSTGWLKSSRVESGCTPRYRDAMISEIDRQQIQTICRECGAKRALLFGSSLDTSREARDIDLAVEGVAPRDFFRFYGERIFALSKPVDAVDLSGQSKFLDLVRRDGVPLLGLSQG